MVQKYKSVILGDVVTLKQLSPEHFESYHTMFSPIVREAVGIPKEQTLEETKKFLAKKVAEIQENKALFYCIFDNATNLLIGSIEMREPGFENGQLGCWINEYYWGHNRYQEALDLLLKEYFKKAGFDEVNVYIKQENIRSVKAHQKYGFTIVREFEKDGTLFYELIIKNR